MPDVTRSFSPWPGLRTSRRLRPPLQAQRAEALFEAAEFEIGRGAPLRDGGPLRIQPGAGHARPPGAEDVRRKVVPHEQDLRGSRLDSLRGEAEQAGRGFSVSRLLGDDYGVEEGEEPGPRQQGAHGGAVIEVAQEARAEARPADPAEEPEVRFVENGRGDEGLHVGFPGHPGRGFALPGRDGDEARGEPPEPLAGGDLAQLGVAVPLPPYLAGILHPEHVERRVAREGIPGSVEGVVGGAGGRPLGPPVDLHLGKAVWVEIDEGVEQVEKDGAEAGCGFRHAQTRGGGTRSGGAAPRAFPEAGHRASIFVGAVQVHLPVGARVKHEGRAGLLLDHHPGDPAHHDAVIPARMLRVEVAFEEPERPLEEGRSVLPRLVRYPGELIGRVVPLSGEPVRDRLLRLREEVHGELSRLVQERERGGPQVEADEHEGGVQREGGERVRGHAPPLGLPLDGDHGDPGGEPAEGASEDFRIDAHAGSSLPGNPPAPSPPVGAGGRA